MWQIVAAESPVLLGARVASCQTQAPVWACSKVSEREISEYVGQKKLAEIKRFIKTLHSSL